MNVVYLIEWVDSFGCPAGWEFLDEVEFKTTTITSIGFLVHQDDEKIVIAPHVSSSEKRQIAGHIAIPRQQILKVTSSSQASFLEELELKLKPQHS